MSRKHFRALAALARRQKQQFKSDRDYAEFCIQLGHTLQEFNYSFNMSTFLKACHNENKVIITAKDLI